MREPIVLESNQNHATITQEGVTPTLPAAMGMGGGYVPMVTTCKARHFVETTEDIAYTLVGTDYKDPPVVVEGGRE